MIDDITERLSTMTREAVSMVSQITISLSRQFPERNRRNFYTVNTHFNAAASESIQEKAERILLNL